MIEQAKFTYPSLGKAFEKQIKTIEDQGEKQIKAIQDQGQVKTIKKYSYDAEDTPFILKQKEIFNKLVDERRKKIHYLVKNVNKNDLIYRQKGNSLDVEFNTFDNGFDIIDKIRDGEIDLADVKYNQEKFKSYLGETKTKETKNINQKSKKTPCIILKCFAKQEMKPLNFMMIIL